MYCLCTARVGVTVYIYSVASVAFQMGLNHTSYECLYMPQQMLIMCVYSWEIQCEFHRALRHCDCVLVLIHIPLVYFPVSITTQRNRRSRKS